MDRKWHDILEKYSNTMIDSTIYHNGNQSQMKINTTKILKQMEAGKKKNKKE